MAQENEVSMKNKITDLFLDTTIVVLLFSQTATAQFYVEWEYNLPINTNHVPIVDKSGNSYFVHSGSVAYVLNKINSDGTLGWQIDLIDRNVGNGRLIMDQSGNIIITVDSIPFAPGGGYDHLTSYLKYSPSGTLIANPSVLEPLFAYFASYNCRAGVDFADNVLMTGITPEWLPCGDNNTCGFGHLQLTFMNDVGLISRITVDQGAEWILDGFCGDIVGPDVNNEFLVTYTNKTPYSPPIYKRYILRCSASSGVIWKRERNPGESFVLGLSGFVYKYSSTGFTKHNRLDNLEWTYNYPSDQNSSIIYENPVDSSVVNLLAPINGALPKTLTCLEQDGSIRWSLVFDHNIMGFDRDGNILAKTLDDSLLQISYIDGSVLSSSSGISMIGDLYTDTLGNIFVASRLKITKLSPLPTLTILDANQDELADKDFYLIRVADDAPLFTPDTLGIVTTDANGKIVLTPTQVTDEFEIQITTGTVTVNTGDRIKIAKSVFSEPAVKHTNLPLSMYSVHLDNGQFDEASVLSYTEITGNNQEIILDHPEFRFNLVVSVEWDATVEYLNSIERSFSNLSNYLYDVTDGQVRLDTVMIYDDQDHWLDADMRIWASNVLHPFSAIYGVNQSSTSDVLNMSRKWFGSLDDSRNGSYDEPQPLDYNDPDNYRQLAHELGHYLLGFSEEYEFTDGNDHCLSVPNYGFMEDPFDNAGVYASEMSNNTMYTFADCRNTKQYNLYGVSCWDMFEIDFEKQYGTDNIFVPVRRPDAMDVSENVTPSGYNYIPGPNDDLGDLNYDVGSLVQFPQVHTNSGGFTIEVVTHDFQLNRLSGIDVTLRNPSFGGGWVDMYQGQSSDVLPGGTQGGGIYVLGAESGAMIQASSQYTMIGSPSPALAASSSFNWMIGEVIVNGPTDTVSMTLTPIEGSFPLVVGSSLSDSNTVSLSLMFESPFNVLPSVNLPNGSSHLFANTGFDYSLEISDSLPSIGRMKVLAVDVSGSPFFFNLDYSMQTTGSNSSRDLSGPSGDFKIELDTISSAVSAFMVSSPYPVLRNGLNANSVAVSRAFSVSLSGDTAGSHRMSIRYTDHDLNPGSGFLVNEMSLAFYRWDETGRSWGELASDIDSVANQVTALIYGSGVYALFSSDIVTDIAGNDALANLPNQFELSQNYPNPFNPTTEISFRLPHRTSVRLEIYNLLGQRVVTLVDGVYPVGLHTITWDGSESASGLYFYKLTAGEYSESRKMILMK